MRPLILMLIVASVCFASKTAFAQSGPARDSYPMRPIKMIIPVAPGGGTDIVGRIAAGKLGEGLGYPVVVENRDGASGMIGSAAVAKSAPDGYTLLLAFASHTTIPFLYPQVPYDVARDFSPISLIATQPLVVSISLSLPANNIREFIALAKAKPGALNAGISTAGGGGHLALEAFKKTTGIDVVSVVYKGGAPALSAMLAGDVHLMIATISQVLPQIKAGRIRTIATVNKKRLPILPDVPSLEESGIRDVEGTPWQGLLGPAGLPAPIVDRLNAEVIKLLKLPDIVQKLDAIGSYPLPSTPVEFGAQIAKELIVLGRIIRETGIKVQ